MNRASSEMSIRYSPNVQDLEGSKTHSRFTTIFYFIHLHTFKLISIIHAPRSSRGLN